VKELIARAQKLTDREVERVLEMLRAAQQEVAAMTATTEWQAHKIPEMKEAVARAIEGFKQKFAASHNETLRNMWEAGIDTVAGPLQFVGLSAVAPELSSTTLGILQGYSADLISGLTSDALKKINGEITMGVMGGKSPFDVMTAIGRNLEDKGAFRSIAARAEAIQRTEMANVHSNSREARAQATVRANPDLAWMKKWLSSGKVHARAHHEALDGVTVPVDEDFLGYIPYPHAPGLAAAEVVNCG